MEQIVSLIGAIFILTAGHQLGFIDRTHTAYNVMNLIGSLVLAVIAYRAQQWGFLLLEAA